MSHARHEKARLCLFRRVFACCVLVAGMGMQQATFAREAQEYKVSISSRSITIAGVFSEIRKQTGLHVFYNNELLNDKEKVSVQFAATQVEKVLNAVLQGKNLRFTITDNYVVIFSAKDKEFGDKSTVSYAPEVGSLLADTVTYKKLSGVVTSNEEGTPLSGAAIKVLHTRKGTSTNAKGEFSIEVQPGDSIAISYIGKADEVIVFRSQSFLTVGLQNATTGLTDVVITGFQTIDRKHFTGSAVKLKAEDVKMDGIIDVSRMLEGRAAGVSIQSVSGTFGTAPKVRVRGATSISGENKPLWVVDGIVLEDIVNISNDQLSSGDPNTLLGSAVAGINASDIESFEILKDASAAALYGARAMNGVIVITTKKGKAGIPRINYTGNYTVFMKPSYDNYNIMNSADQMSVYLEMERKGWLNFSDVANASDGGVFIKLNQLYTQYDSSNGAFGISRYDTDARRNYLTRYQKANTNWFDHLFRNSLAQEHSLSISSGTDASQLYISTSYFNDQGWSIGDNVKRYTANVRANYKLSEKLTAGFITAASVRKQTAPGSNSRVSNTVEGKYTRDFDINPFSYAINTSRALTAYDENGDLEYFTRNYAPFNIVNELANNSIKMGMMDLKLQGELGYKIIPGLEVKVLGAIRYVKTSREHMIKESSNMAMAYRADYNSTIKGLNRFLYLDPDNPDVEKVSVLPQGGFYNRTEDELSNYNVRSMVTYKKKLGSKHAIDVLAGQEVKYTNRQNAYNYGYGYQYAKGGIPFIDYRILKQALEGNFNYYGMSMNYDRFLAFFSNFQYSFNDRYNFSATMRYDGSNRMGKSEKARWLPTWTLGGAWNIDQEEFMRGVRSVDFLKLRGSYGLSASLGTATNSTVVLENGSTNRPYLSDAESQISIANLENSELTWEKQYSSNIAVDAGFAKGRFTVTAEYYHRNGFDLIGPVRTTGIGGQSTKTVNYAKMRSHGYELTLGTRMVKTRNWTYTTNLTFGYNKNRVTDLKSTPRIYDLVQAEGGALEGAPFRGLYSLAFAGLNPANGMPMLVNESGSTTNKVNAQSTSTKYLVYAGPVDPIITGGLNNTITYKKLSVNLFFSYQTGNKIRMSPVYKSFYTDLDAMPREFLNRWTLPGDEKNTNVPSILDAYNYKDLSDSSSYLYSNYNYSTARVADGSFVRLKTASVQYTLSPKWLAPIGAKSLVLGLVATNVWLIYADKKLQGQDPEFFASGGVALPMPRQFTLSAKLGF